MAQAEFTGISLRVFRLSRSTRGGCQLDVIAQQLSLVARGQVATAKNEAGLRFLQDLGATLA